MKQNFYFWRLLLLLVARQLFADPLFFDTSRLVEHGFENISSAPSLIRPDSSSMDLKIFLVRRAKMTILSSITKTGFIAMSFTLPVLRLHLSIPLCRTALILPWYRRGGRCPFANCASTAPGTNNLSVLLMVRCRIRLLSRLLTCGKHHRSGSGGSRIHRLQRSI